MNTYQLEKILANDSFTSILNPSVKPLDHFLETKLYKPSMTIVNYDTCDKPGSHWVAVYFPTSGNKEFFDSYGMEPRQQEFISKLLETGETNYNVFPLQGFSTVCGQYCAIFLLLRARGYSFDEIISYFSFAETSDERDEIVNLIINSRYGKYFSSPLPVYDETMMYVQLSTMK